MANEPAPNTQTLTGPTSAHRAAGEEFGLSPQERFARDQAAQRAADPWKDPNAVIVGVKDGKPVLKGKEPPAKIDPTSILDPEARAVTAESHDRVKVGDVELSPEEIQAAVEHKAAEDSRKATLPASPSEYRLELPPDLVLPEGIKFEFKPNDKFLGPAIAKLQEHAIEQGWDQAQLSKVLGLYAASQVHQQTMLRDARAAEVKKLGDAGPARVDAILTWIRALLPADVATQMSAMLVNERIVVGFEKIIQRVSDYGGSGNPGAGRDSETGPRISDAQWNAMTYSEKKDYAQRNEQAQSSRRR